MKKSKILNKKIGQELSNQKQLPPKSQRKRLFSKLPKLPSNKRSKVFQPRKPIKHLNDPIKLHKHNPKSNTRTT